MKPFYSLLIVLIMLFPACLQAQFSYTGYARDCNCEMLTASSCSLRVEIIAGHPGNTLVFREHFTPTLTNGVYTITIGNGQNQAGNWNSITWAYPTFVKIVVDGYNENVLLLASDGDGPIVENPTCEPAIAGVVRYFENGEIMQFCNGTSWVNLCGSGACDHLTSITDGRDGRVYGIVAIGDQCWMSENLNFGEFTTRSCTQTEHSDCDEAAVTEKYCNENSSPECEDHNGGLYEWNELDDTHGNICPDGWHVPSDDEWKTLEGFLGMTTDLDYNNQWRGTTPAVGTKLKIGGSSGFEAISTYSYSEIGCMQTTVSKFWTSTLDSSSPYQPYYRYLHWEGTGPAVYRGTNLSGKNAMSVRCLKNN